MSPRLIPQAAEKLRAKLETLVEQMRADYLASGLKASGYYGENIEVVIEDNPARILAQIQTPHYAEYMTFGREPTKRSEGGILRGIIEQWVSIKPGLPPPGWTIQSFAYVVTQNIHREGITVPNRYNPGDITTQAIDRFVANELDGILNELGIEAVNNIQSDLIPDLQKRFKDAIT